MTRNSRLFGASLTVGAIVAGGVLTVAAGSRAATAGAATTATAYGVAWDTALDSGSWQTGQVGDDIFTANATVTSGTSTVTFAMPMLGVGGITVTTSCVSGAPQVVIAGGGAAGTYSSPTSITAAAFTGESDAVGTVSLLSGSGPTVGAYYDLTAAGLGNDIKLGGVTCATVTPPPSTSSPSTSPTTSPTSSSSSSSNPSSTSSPAASPTATSTSTPVPTPSSPTPSSPTTTEPPTPTATVTTKLPVTG